jgi:hypothetical protein
MSLIDAAVRRDPIMRRCLIALCSFFIAIHCVLAYAQETVYFMCADKHKQKYFDDSFVLPLSRPEDVREARRLLKEVSPMDQPFPVVKIAVGADGINRDHLAVGAPQWSWHVTEFLGFPSIVVPEYEYFGTPTLIEENLEKYKVLGEAGFVSHAIVAELRPPFKISVRVTAEGVVISWPWRGQLYVYTVECASTLSPADWAPVAGTAWPIAETTWVDKTPLSSGPRFYRIRSKLKLP